MNPVDALRSWQHAERLDLLGEYRFWKWGGIGGGININTLKLNAKDDDEERQLDLHHGIGAAQLYLFFVYLKVTPARYHL